MRLGTARTASAADVLMRWMDGERHSLQFHCLPPIPSPRICSLLILFLQKLLHCLGVRSLLLNSFRQHLLPEGKGAATDDLLHV